MTERARTRLLAAAVGLVVALVAVGGGVWLAAALDDTPEPDGWFVLDEPGVYDQPLDDVNADLSGDRVPDVPLIDAAGDEQRLSELVGRPVVVNMWFSNCAPCRRELVDFAEVHRHVGDAVEFVGVNPFDTVESMERFAGDRGVEYALWRDPDQAFVNAAGIVGYPVTLFVAPNGEVLRQTGELDAAELRDAIEELF